MLRRPAALGRTDHPRSAPRRARGCTNVEEATESRRRAGRPCRKDRLEVDPGPGRALGPLLPRQVGAGAQAEPSGATSAVNRAASTLPPERTTPARAPSSDTWPAISAASALAPLGSTTIFMR